MRSVLSQLEDDQAILLMYLAEELPPADRAVVDKRLISETALRDELEKLRATHEGISQSLAALDRAQPIAPASAAMQRKLSRMFKQWAADRALHEVSESTRQRGLFVRFAPAYPFVAAAALLIGFVIWWGLRDDGLNQIATTTNSAEVVSDALPTSPVAEAAESDPNPFVDAETEKYLDKAQEGIDELALLSGAIADENTVSP